MHVYSNSSKTETNKKISFFISMNDTFWRSTFYNNFIHTLGCNCFGKRKPVSCSTKIMPTSVISRVTARPQFLTDPIFLLLNLHQSPVISPVQIIQNNCTKPPKTIPTIKSVEILLLISVRDLLLFSKNMYDVFCSQDTGINY